MTLLPGEVVLIRIGFHEASGGKIRPAVVLLDTGDDDFVAAPITSRLRTSDFEVTIQDWRAVGLNMPSTIRVHKLAVLAKNEIIRRLGSVSETDRAALNSALRRAFSLAGAQ